MGVIVPSGSASVKVNHGFTVSVSENRYKKYGVPTADFLFSSGTLENAITNVNPITFNRNSIGTYVDENGVIQSAASGEARFDHDPVTGESLGLLVEESRTNSYRYSNEFTNAAWGKNQVILTPNAAEAPDGTFTATKISATTVSTDEHILVHTTSAGSGIQTIWSVYAKAGENTKIGLRRNASDGLDLGQVDLINGTLLRAVPGYTTTITNAANGWWRISLSFSATAAAYLRPCICPIPDSLPITADADTPYSDDGSSGIYIWGAQLEVGSFPTSYIPTPATFTSRASTATYYDANGVIQTAAIDEARDDAYFPDENGVMTSAGLLLEGVGTNDNPHSEHVNLYSTTELTTRENQELAPDLSFTAGTIIETTANSYHKLFLNPTPATGNLTLSTFIKNKQGNRNALLTFNDGGNDLGFYFNPSSGSVVGVLTGAGTTTPLDYGVQKLANDWYRIHVSGIATASSGQSALYVIDNTTNSTHVGTGTDGFYVWGFQMEQNNYPSSYIETPPSFFSRSQTNADSASFYQSDGTIGYASTDVVRDNVYFPDENGTFYPAGTLLEPEIENLMPYSEDFNSWSNKNNISVSTDTAETNAPDGTQTADKITNTANETGLNNTISSITGTHTVSVYVKYSGTTNWVRMTSGIGNPEAWFDINNGTVGTQSNGAVGRIQPVGNGWYRCIMTANFSGVTVFAIMPSSANGSTVEGNGNSLYVWGCQIEANSYDTSYIPTTSSTATRGRDFVNSGSSTTRSADNSTSSTVTRNADDAIISGSEFSSFYNLTEGSFFVNGGPKQIDSSSAQVLFSADSGSGTHRTQVLVATNTSAVKLRVQNSGVSQVDTTISGTTVAGNNDSKISARYGTNDFRIDCQNLNGIDTSGTPSTSLTQFNIGSRYSPAQDHLNGHIKRLTYWTNKLSDSQLERITQ